MANEEFDESTLVESLISDIDLCEWLDQEANGSIDLIEEIGEQQQEAEYSPSTSSGASNMEKRKRGRPTLSSYINGGNGAAAEKAKSLRKFEHNGKSYAFFGNTCVEVGSEKYRFKRVQSCEAVKRYRQKKEREAKELRESVYKLTEENHSIAARLENLSVEIEFLKRFVADQRYLN